MPKEPVKKPSPAKAAKKTAYHHGALRPALIARGLQLLEEHGANALSLRFVSRELGVSQTAPYHHFVDKGALLAALAAEGFKELTEQIVRSRDKDWTFERRIFGLCAGVTHFARNKPELFKLMYGGQLGGLTQYPELLDSASENYRIYVASVHETLKLQKISLVDAEYAAMSIFAMAYGIATFVITPRLGPAARELIADGRELTTHAARIIAAGLLAHAKDEENHTAVAPKTVSKS